MKLKPTWDWRNSVFDIQTAVQAECYDDCDGLAETAMASAKKTAELLGRLIERLHGSGKLSDDDVIAVLGSWECADTEGTRE